MFPRIRPEGRAPTGSVQPVTVSSSVPGAGRAAPGTRDLRRLMAWRSAGPQRSVELHGYDGRQGVTLVEHRRGVRYVATRDSISGAVCAVASGLLPFRAVPEEETRLASKRQRGQRTKKAKRNV